MPWHCPACNSIIRHNEIEEMPRTGERYRCHICRLTLDFDAATRRLKITELEVDHAVADVAERGPRTLPTPVAPPPEKRKRPTRTRHK